jgi:dolichol-phosphate mannosyltransferase
MGILNLLPEEAYYWNYAKHLSIGYLDHPPMVAWLIYLSDAIFGRSEFAVRLPAVLGWFALAYFMFRLTRETVGETAGRVVLLLLAVLPIYMSVGFLMTPDAPFYVCWSGALYFLARALLKNRPKAWYGAGVFLGLGLLSKYTMGLIVLASVAYMLLDRDARRWFLRPHPYVAVLIGLLLFSPVLYWNAEHQWVSFVFQGPRRWSGGIDFDLHILIGSILVLLTPLGFYEALRAIWDIRTNRVRLKQSDLSKYRNYTFLVTFTLVPLLVFMIHSLQGQPKLNWTGPVWLSLLPVIAVRIYGTKIWQNHLSGGGLAKRWLITASALVIFFAAGFAFMADGMPGIKKDSEFKFPIAWKAYGRRVEEIETRLKKDTDSEPIVIGLDKYWLASQANFYDPDGDTHVYTRPEIGGENLVGGNSLMWNSWVLPETVAGRTGLLLSFTAEKLQESQVIRHFGKVGDITKELLTDRDGELGYFYWRIGYNYQPN